VLVLANSLSYSQIVSSFSSNDAKIPKDSAVVNASGVKSFVPKKDTTKPNFGFMPFTSGENSLRTLYESEEFNSPKNYGLSFIGGDSVNNTTPATFIEAISFIPKNIMKVSLSIGLTSNDMKDTVRAVEDIALQKLISGGGNISLAFERPLFYDEFYSGSFLLINGKISLFADVPVLNKEIIEPAAGFQGQFNMDFRIYQNESSAQDGNIYRIGFRAAVIYNNSSDKYAENFNIDRGFSSIAFAPISAYLGLSFIDISYTYIFGSPFFDGRRSVLKFSVMPVKY
jgi:hypothetical protein